LNKEDINSSSERKIRQRKMDVEVSLGTKSHPHNENTARRKVSLDNSPAEMGGWGAGGGERERQSKKKLAQRKDTTKELTPNLVHQTSTGKNI
jgi:hypothetical protein